MPDMTDEQKKAAEAEAAKTAEAAKAAEAEKAKAAKDAAGSPPQVVNVTVQTPDRAQEGAAANLEAARLQMDVAKGKSYTSKEGREAKGVFINGMGQRVDVDGQPVKKSKDDEDDE